uniref:Putative secreted protein n=1 Tax=Ixodes ricinus TaxID=34613 RepID=A0A6B0U3B2_IXORI
MNGLQRRRRARPFRDWCLGWCLLVSPTSFTASCQSFNVAVKTWPRKVASCACLHSYHASMTCMRQVEHIFPRLCGNDHSGASQEATLLH